MNDRQIIDEFVVESRDHLADVESQLLAIESGGAQVDPELVNTVFRAVHSIKGAAGFFQFTNIEQLSHEMENVLSLIGKGRLAPNPALTDVMLRAADTLRSMIENIDAAGEVDVSWYVRELQAAAANPSGAAAPTNAAPPAAPPPAMPVEVEKNLELAEQYVAQAAAAEPLPPLPFESAPQASAAVPAADANIRVAVRTLDHLMNLAGELVLARNQLLQTVAARDRGNLDSVSARLNQVTSEIQEAVMQTRLQAVDTVFSKFPRIVRDLCNTLGKQCDLVIEGEDVELDKSIIEAIGDPLTHLIRNAVDHGLESPEDRIRAGKQPRGRILLKAFHQAGKVHLSVGDDGAGINVGRLKEQAVARGIVSAEQARELGDNEAARLIFQPGLSTAEQLTNLSGRGVGMDVVKTNIERLGGTVEVDTQLGVGATIGITLPLTLAIIPSLIVSCDGRRFAIPQASISELVMVKAANVAERVQKIKNAEVLRLRGHLLPLVRLRTAMGLDGAAAELQYKADNTGNVNVIVLDSGRLSYGLVVDTLHDSEEIVVKPLGKHIKDCRCFAGATILGDGQVALILDVAGLSTQAELNSGDERQTPEAAAAGASAAAADQDAHAMLLFTNGLGEQFAVPMGLISRLERIRAEQIDSVGGQEVLQYRGGSLPLLSLEKFIKAQPRPELARLYVVVFRVGQREVGMVAPQLTDIRHVSTNVDTMTLREPGVIGSMVLDGKTTRLLDLFDLTHIARPDWFREDPAAAAKPSGETKILLAEDSGFFRRQLTSFFQADSYTVKTCVDGQEAWETLCRPGESYDLVVTDLDMPRMNGFELAEKIRDNPALKHLPIVAVTSLASDEDIEYGRKVGINEYHIKLDRDRLMATVAGFLRAKTRAVGGPLPTACGGRT